MTGFSSLVYISSEGRNTNSNGKEEALRMAKVVIGLSLISTVSFKSVESVNESEIWSSIGERA